MRLFIGKKGLYEILLAFFTITILIFAVIFFLSLGASSTALFAKVRQSTQVPTQALTLKDALLACHRLDYLVESRFNEACKADHMMRGYRVVQLPINGCEEKQWDHARGAYSQAIPFIVAVQQADAGKRCLARLEVLA